MEDTVRYYALVLDDGTVYNIFREVHMDGGMWLERLDPDDWNRWVDDTRGLASYVFRGELGSREITEDDARRIVEDRGAVFRQPVSWRLWRRTRIARLLDAVVSIFGGPRPDTSA